MVQIIRDYVGFGVNVTDMIHHYAGIWRILGPNRVCLVPIGGAELRQEVAAIGTQMGLPVVAPEQLLAKQTRFETFVSHHYLDMTSHGPLFKLLGLRNLRFMYSLAQDGWNFADWNAHYDGFLCYGPYQAQRFAAAYPDRAVVQMGYPRYDAFFGGGLPLDEIRRELGCDPAKPTVVWLPTYSVFASIDRYCDAMAALTGRFNVVVKPHPSTVAQEPARMERLRAAGFTCLIEQFYDNLNLYAIADWIVGDYGGPIFGALYTDRNLLLLNLPGIADHSLVGEDSPEIQVRRSILSTDQADAGAIAALFDDAALWQQQAACRKALRQHFFAPFYGFSAQIAATLIGNASKLFIER